MAKAEQNRAVLPPRGAGIFTEIGEKFCALFIFGILLFVSQSSDDFV